MNTVKIKLKLEISLQILFVIWCIIIPWSMAGMQILLGLLLVNSIVLAILKRKSPIIFHPYYIFLLIYLISELISIIYSSDWKLSLNASFANDWVIITVPLLISLSISSEWRVKAFKALIVSASIVAFYGIIQFFIGFDIIKAQELSKLGNFYRAIGTYGGFYTFGGNQLFAFAISLAFLILSKEWNLERTKYSIFTIIIFLSIISSFTRSAWIAAIIIILLGALTINKRKFIYVSIILVLVGLLLFNMFPDLQNRFISIFSQSQNEGRLTLWATSWNILKQNLYFGIGHGNFPKYFLLYKVPGFYDAFSHPHNDYLNVLVLNGIVGFISWISMWVAGFYFLIKNFIKLDNIEPDKKIILASIFGITGILIAAQFQCFYTDLENNIFWWLLVSTGLQVDLHNRLKQNSQPVIDL